MNDFHPLPVDLPVTHAQPSQVYAKRAIWAVVALLLVGGSARALMNSQEAKALETYTSATLERTVLTTKATPGKLEQTLRLPTTLRGNSESVIYARTSGYIAA